MHHDRRRTFITVAESLDIPAYALKRQLNHKTQSDVTAGYIEEPAVRIHRIRTGAKANFMVGAANTLGVSRETIFGLLGLPTSTANRKIAKGETLEIPVTERLARLAIVEHEAEETFGNPKVARQWLLSANTGLGGCSPLSMLDTDVGTREVFKALVAIAYGGVV